MDFETRAIHEGQEPDPATGAVSVPIYQTSTYVQEAVGEHKGYDYSRGGNPTRTALQLCLASLESAEHGIAFSSGLGATTTIMHLVNPGDSVVLIADAYGGGDPRGRGDPRRRQHLRDPISAAAARARRRHRRPLDDEVPRRALRRDRRFCGHERPDDRRAALLPAEVAGRGAGAVRLLAHPPWDQDARPAHAPTLRERACDCRLAVAPQARREGALPRAADASRTHDRGPADARLRRDDLVPGRVRGGGRRPRRADEALQAGRIPRRSREPDRAPGADDARIHRGRPVRVAEEPRAPLGRDRVRGGPDRRSRGRAGARGHRRRRLTLRNRPRAAGVDAPNCERRKEPLMATRLALVLAVLATAALLPATALGKEIKNVTITGPGLGNQKTS